MFDTGRLTKYQISKILDVRRPPFCKWFYCYVLAADHLLLMKFDADANFNTKTRHVTKIKTCKYYLQRWRNEKRGIVSFSVYMKNDNKIGGCVHNFFLAISSPIEITQM